MLQAIIAYAIVAGAFVAMVWMLFLSPQTKWNIKRRLQGKKPFPPSSGNCGEGCGCDTQTVQIREHKPKPKS